MSYYTLDTNCIISLAEDRSSAGFLRGLVSSHGTDNCVVRLVAVAASERQQDRSHLSSFTQFRNRLSLLNLSHLEILKPPAYLNVSFLDWCILHGDELLRLEGQIHEILFPNIPLQLKGHSDSERKLLWSRWLNAKCDVLTMFCHIHYGGDIFVTSDKNFHKSSKKNRLIALGAGSIIYPEEINLTNATLPLTSPHTPSYSRP